MARSKKNEGRGFRCRLPKKSRLSSVWEDDSRRRLLVLGMLLAAGIFLLNVEYASKRLRFVFSSPVRNDAVEEVGRDQHLLDLRGNPDRLLVPSLGIEAPIVFATERNERSYQGALRYGVAHFPGTAEVGQFGNTYLFGHSSDLPFTAGDYKTVFALLPEIELGTDVYVTDSLGNVYRYRAVETKVVSPKDLSVLDQFNNEKRMLTLQTSYPIGTALRRFVVLCELSDELLLDESQGE